MKVLTGHLTEKDKKAVKAILDANLLCGKVGKANYFLSIEGGVYNVAKQVMDKGLIPVYGSSLRLSIYRSSFSI